MASILPLSLGATTDLRWPLIELPPEVRMIVEDAVRVYDVAVDHGSLKMISLGRRGLGYKVRLTGSIDGRWAEAFSSARSGSRDLACFELDRPEGAVSFSFAPDAPPTEIIGTLEKLDDLIYESNALASR